MPRPKGSKNKKTLLKEQQASAAGGAPMGHNSGDLSPEHQQALFLHHRSKISKLKTELASASSALRNAYKVAKAEGYEKKDFDYADFLEKHKPEESIAERERQRQVAAWMAHPIGTQANMFEDTRSLYERALEEGQLVGAKGDPATPPSNYSPGTDGYNGWMEGWHKGNAGLFAIKKPTTDGGLLRTAPEGGEPGPDDFDHEKPNTEGGAGEWPDDAQANANKTGEPAAAQPQG